MSDEKQAEPVRGWAVRNPKGQIVVHSVSLTFDGAWDKFIAPRGSEGYTVVPVDITEREE